MTDAILRFESSLPELRRILTSRCTDATELMLVGEMRRVMGDIAGKLSVAAEVEGDARLERLARRAFIAAAAAPHPIANCE